MKVGIVGCGFMGRMHYRCWQAQPGATVTAICEANPDVLKQAGQGNVDGAADQLDLSSVEIYTDFDEMLAKADLDAVSITLPTFLHADFTVKALESGVNVLCEKPMALSLEECDRMTAAASTTGKTLMIAHCIRFWPEFAKAKEIIDSGEYGKVLSASFRREGSPPSWAADGWFMDKKRSGGMVLDLHIHDTDFVHYVFGIPKAVSSFGVKGPGGVIGHIVSRFDYGDNQLVVVEGGWMMPDSFGFEMSFQILLEKAVLVLHPAQDPMFKVMPNGGEPFTPEVADGDGYSREIAHFAAVVDGKETLSVVTPQQSRETVRIIFAEEESVEKGAAVEL